MVPSHINGTDVFHTTTSPPLVWSTVKVLKIVASHLSRYCAYLVSWCPELLPDDDAWSKGLYKAVKKDAERVLAGGHTVAGPPTPEAKFRRLMEVLNADNTKHEVLKNGARLGGQLVVASDEDEEGTAWKLQAEFWSELILYVAPSDTTSRGTRTLLPGAASW
ncbi:hypothetical protein ACP70R_014545 [Stipagrostis hirtigluma subsp. patula]